MRKMWMFFVFLFLACGTHANNNIHPQNTILIRNNGAVSATVSYEDGTYLGRVSASSSKCFYLRTTSLTKLLIERGGRVYLSPRFNPSFADGWEMSLSTYPSQTEQEMMRTLLPHSRCK